MLRRILALLLTPLLIGCQPQIAERANVVSKDGRHRLTLRYTTRDQRAFDFYDLILDTKTAVGWDAPQVIWRGTQLLPPNRRRWVAQLHSVDPEARTAIIKIGTESVPDAQGVVHVEYAWVHWDLTSNRLLETLQVCDDPFALFTGNAP
jgi:hypothetical protein